MGFNFVKRAVRKAMLLVGIQTKAGVIIKSPQWVKAQAKRFDGQTLRNMGMDIETNAINYRTYPQLSRAVECVVNELSEQNTYTFRNMIALLNPYQYAPLCALVLFNTKKTYRVRVTVFGKTRDCDISYTFSGKTKHRIPVMGLYADYQNKVKIELLNKRDIPVRKKVLILPTKPLTGNVSKVEVHKEFSTQPFLYDLTLVYGGANGVDSYAFDKNGDIRYTFALTPKTYGFQPFANGKVMFLHKGATRLTNTNTASLQLYETDQMGRFYKLYNIEKGAHHDFVELPNGNIVTAGNDIENHTCEDTVIELHRETGKVVHEILLKDYIDPKYVSVSDWAHVNSIGYDSENKTAIVSMRNLHAVVKIDFEKKELLWILANPLFFEDSFMSEKVLTPTGVMEWFFQQHAAYFLEEDLDGNPETKHLIVYDNHVDKRTPVSYFDHDAHSFVRIYTINETLKTVSLWKSFPCEKSSKRSNGILEKEAGRVMAMNGNLKNCGAKKGSITEFDYNTGKKINQYAINYSFYRAYEMKFETDKMAEPMEIDTDYCLGTIYGLNECAAPDTSKAEPLPEPVLEEPDKTEEERKTRLEKICRKNPDYDVDPKQDMARISMAVREDILYVSLLDHQLERIYFVGKNHSYYRDYTDTVQERPEYFARAVHTDIFSLNTFCEDAYEIYFQHHTGLFWSKYYVKIRKNEVKA